MFTYRKFPDHRIEVHLGKLRDERKSRRLRVTNQTSLKKSLKNTVYSEKRNQQHKSSFKTIRRPVCFMSFVRQWLKFTEFSCWEQRGAERSRLSSSEHCLFALERRVTSGCPGANQKALFWILIRSSKEVEEVLWGIYSLTIKSSNTYGILFTLWDLIS